MSSGVGAPPASSTSRPARAPRPARGTGSRAARARAGRRRAACRGRGSAAPRRSALASWATTGRSPSGARRASSGAVARRRRAPRPPARDARSATLGSSANSSPSGDLGRRARRARARRPRAASRTSASVASRAPRRSTRRLGGGAGAAASSPTPSASSRRRSGSRSSNSRKTSRSSERSGSRDGLARAGRRRPATSRWIVASCLEMRASSAWSVRFSLRLAPEISSTLAEHGLEVAELLQQVRRGLVADARDAGDVVRRVALEAVEVGDQLGRDAVAVDHRLVVVELRLGDPARGGHDLDAARRGR